MAQWGDIEARVETAILDWLEDSVDEANRTGYDLVQAIAGGTLDNTDRIVVYATRAEERPGLKGNFAVTVNVSVRTKLNPPDDRTALSAAHRSVTGYIRDQLDNSQLDTDLMATATDVKFQSGPLQPRGETSFDEDVMISTFEFEIIACPAP